MKAICEGRKTRAEVVQETIDQYRAVYILSQRRMNALHTVNRILSNLPSVSLLINPAQAVRKYILGENG